MKPIIRYCSGPLLCALCIYLAGCAAADAPPAGVITPALAEPPRPVPLMPPVMPAVSKRTAAPVVEETFFVQLQRGPCYGRCPQYRVRIDTEGVVTFVGTRFVAATGEQRGQADAGALAALITLLQRPEMRDMKDIYRPGQAGCGAVATDMPNSDLEWQINGHRHTLRLYQGCSKLPPTLRQLPAAIDAAADSRRWIEDGSDR